MKSIITSVKRNVKLEGADEKTEGGLLIAKKRDLDIECIITATRRIVKSREFGEKAKEDSLQKRSVNLGIIITDVN